MVVWVLILLIVGDPSWLDVPYVAQTGAGCGAASIAMVMQYWIRQQPGLDSGAADADRIYRLLSREPGKVISGQALKRYLEGQGFAAFVFDGERLSHLVLIHVGRGERLLRGGQGENA